MMAVSGRSYEANWRGLHNQRLFGLVLDSQDHMAGREGALLLRLLSSRPIYDPHSSGQ